ncbi:MAG: pyruvate, phosphate dikinase, partial [Deltaproteobacteria bacterium]|nr:pyruvate, phosphate dikinase [Deltaproteobacteria bacterium]
MASKALEINLASSRVDVTVEARYRVLQEVMGAYEGVRRGLENLLEEICHPYKNWSFIVKEARSFALNYLHLLKKHPRGPEALGIYADMFLQAVESSPDETVRANAADNLLLLVQKLLKEGGEPHAGFAVVLEEVFERIRSFFGETFMLFVKSFYQLNTLGELCRRRLGRDASFGSLNRLLTAYYRAGYGYWLSQEDLLSWFVKESGLKPDRDLTDIFRPITHGRLKALTERLEEMLEAKHAPVDLLESLVELPGYGDLVFAFSHIPRRLFRTAADDGEGNRRKLLILLRMMNIPGLSAVHEETLRDINRTLSRLITHVDPKVLRASLEKTFEILSVSAERFPATALSYVLNIGQGVYRTYDSDQVDFFIDSVVSLGFKSPDMHGVGEDWQMRADPTHVQNIRTWLQLIGMNPKWSKKLLSSLAVHLSLEGVLVRDTDLFPRDITRFLNSDIAPVYNLSKQLCRLFPAFFNDIGAEGDLREVSTRIDEICLRKDPLIHFLRKQSHVESSNQIMGLMEGTLHFWRTRSKAALKPFLPPQVYEEIETEGPFIDGVHLAMNHLSMKMGEEKAIDYLRLDEGRLNPVPDGIAGVSDTDVERIRMALSMYRLLYQKYHLSFTEMDGYLARLRAGGLPDPGELKETLALTDEPEKLERLLDYLEKLKKIILSAEAFEIREDIYRKRHFTVDIPSMYGSYHEMKFDALGLAFRLESLVNVLFENMVKGLDLELITRATFSRIRDCLRLFDQALRLDGISSIEMERQLDLLTRALEIRGFSLTQYLDIFRGFSQAVSNVVNDYFNNIHHANILKIVEQVPVARILPRYLPAAGPADPENTPHRVTEIFLRERISASLGLQQLDNFLGRVL